MPNTLLGAPLLSGGAWNAAHFKNPTYDGLVAQYIATIDLGKQRELAGKIQALLLEETPVIFAYFYDHLIATAAGVGGITGSGVGQVFLANATIS